MTHRERIPGGLASGLSPRDFDLVALRRGTRVEMEHTSDPHVAREIAMDHLVEDPRYYQKLAKMERKENGMFDQNPRRPPKGWFSDCVRGVRAGAHRSGRSVRDPAAVCGAQWQRLSATKKRAAMRRHERRRNPYGYIPNPW